MSTATTALRLVGAGAVTIALVASGTAAANAKGGHDVRTSGSCSASSTWKLKAKPDNAKVQIELEVDSNVVGQTWAVSLQDNGASVFAGTAVTVGPSGSFTARKLTPNRAGADRVVAVATNAATGETCRGALTLR
ncbi:hypothetical protein V3N99_12430 [Dermatophilaceae bacterium Soc4.6]